MDSLYPFLLIIHLSCAIIFVGYLFFDVVIYPNVKRALPPEIYEKVSNAIMKRGRKIMPSCVLLLLITGALMATRWLGWDVGFWESNLQKFLIIKIIFASVIFIAVATSLSCAFVFKCRNPLGDIIHPLALTLSVFIVILAKVMFYF